MAKSQFDVKDTEELGAVSPGSMNGEKKFQEGVQVTVRGVIVSTPVLNFVKNERTKAERKFASFRVRVLVGATAWLYDCVASGTKEHDEGVNSIMEMVKPGAMQRAIVIGMPADQVFNERVQHKVNIDEFWAEDLGVKKFMPVILPKPGEKKVVEREDFQPIEMPEVMSDV